jgi:hypothetical protein
LRFPASDLAQDAAGSRTRSNPTAPASVSRGTATRAAHSAAAAPRILKMKLKGRGNYGALPTPTTSFGFLEPGYVRLHFTERHL